MYADLETLESFTSSRGVLSASCDIEAQKMSNSWTNNYLQDKCEVLIVVDSYLSRYDVLHIR